MTEMKPVKKKEPRWIKFFTEHLPLILFLIAYVKGDLNLAIKVNNRKNIASKTEVM